MKDRVNQLFKDKLFLVMLVLGLLTIVAAAGVVTVQRGNGGEQSPYLDMQNQNNLVAEESRIEETVELAGNSEATPQYETESQARILTQGPIDEPVAQVGAEKGAATAMVLNFSDSSKMVWPVHGNILLDYSMDSTIYFPTLDQYKCNPGIVIQSDVSTPVLAPANAKIKEIGNNEELGSYVVMDLGNDFTAICGQLKEMQVLEGEYIKEGSVLGYVAEPTKYYSVEGSNVFFQLKLNNKTLDPLDYVE